MTESIRLHISGEPTAWARSGQHGRRHFTPAKQAVAMDVIRLQANRVMAGRALLEGPLSLRAKFIYAWPKSWSEKRRKIAGAHWKTSRPDFDNLSKLIGDALNEVVWVDDAVIASATIEKQYGMAPSTQIIIENLTHQAEEEAKA